MIRLFFYLFMTLLLSSCSLQTEPNQWQYKSVNAFDSYIKNFLQSNDTLAKSDLQRAVKHAKMSANLTSLSRIYLGQCALNISVGIKDKCDDYKNITELVNNHTLDAYYSFISLSIQNQQISLLPKKYQDFAFHLQSQDYSKANNDILQIKDATSQLLAASLIKENITIEVRQTMIDTASFHGYKKAVIFWLNEAKEATKNKSTKQILSKKIYILKSKD